MEESLNYSAELRELPENGQLHAYVRFSNKSLGK